MKTEHGPLPSAENPFAAFLSPEVLVAAHERLGKRFAGVVHRPLDKLIPAKPADEIFIDFGDDDIEFMWPDEPN
jgi:hypothetical protein